MKSRCTRINLLNNKILLINYSNNYNKKNIKYNKFQIKIILKMKISRTEFILYKMIIKNITTQFINHYHKNNLVLQIYKNLKNK